MKNIFINGKFLCQNVTGVQRFAIEIIKCLDKIDHTNVKFSLITPSEKYIKNILDLKKISIIHLTGKPNYYWEQVRLARFCKKNKPDDLLNLCNIAPVLFPGSCVIHDIAWIDAPSGLSKKFKMIYKFITWKNVKKYKNIFTVSYTMKKRIEMYYKVDNIFVIYNDARHMSYVNPVKPKCDLPDNFYFSLGSMNPNKNFKAIVNLANKYPYLNFVISGNTHKSFSKESTEKLNNLIYTGYLNDSELAYLYQNCDAFLFPSIYEGFGIPPLEAIICGCKNVICNDIPVLRELYGELVSFVDFNNIDFIEKIIPYENSNSLKLVEEKFNWMESACKVYDVLNRD